MKKYKIGYTTGVFDMFHVGHLNLFKYAKDYCDYLIVGVHSDDWVMKWKNKMPIIPFEDRMKIVEAIKYVDKVVPQFDKDKVSAYEKYKFDVMFVGDDWKGCEIFKIQSFCLLANLLLNLCLFCFYRCLPDTY